MDEMEEDMDETDSSFQSRCVLQSQMFDKADLLKVIQDATPADDIEAELKKKFNLMNLKDAMDEDVGINPIKVSKADDEKLKEELKNLVFEAVRGGNVAALQQVTWLGANLSWVNQCGESLVHVAAKKGRAEMLKYLCRQGCQLSNDIMFSAVTGGNLDCVKFLIECNIDPCDHLIGADLLCRAAEIGNIEIIKELTNRSSEFINALDAYKVTPLFYAAKENNLEAVDLLISLGAEINASILTMTLDENEEMFKHLITKGGDANTFLLYPELRQTPLLFSTLRNNVEMVDFLLDHGADIEERNESGWSCVHIAAFYDFTSMLQKLIDRGANVNSFDLNYFTPLNVAKARTGKILEKHGGYSVL